MEGLNIEGFLNLLKRHLLWFILLPIITGGMAWYVTRNEVKTYKSQATLYTGLVSGYTLLTDKQNSFSDQSASAFDNILTTLFSKETLLQIGSGLLAEHLMLQRPDSVVLGGTAFQQLRQAIPPGVRARLLGGATDSTATRAAIDSLAKMQGDNPIKTLLIKSDSYYSVRRLTDKLKASARKNTNDVLLMDYEANDPAVARQTLYYAIRVLNKRYAFFKTSETNSVVTYYEGKLKQARQALDIAETNLRNFNVENQVLDFGEESRNVASSREALLNEYNEELMRRNAAKAAMDALSERTGQQSSVRTASSDLAEKQKKLTEAERKLANARAYGQSQPIITRLQAAVTQAANELKISAQRYDATANTNDAVPQATIATDRLAKQVEFEESSARLKLYKSRIDAFEAKTQQYSPLSSRLRELERALSLSEKEYLGLLEQVEQSRTRRQDVAVGGQLEILDAPDFPTAPIASKRTQLIIIGIGVGLFLALLLTALRFWLNKQIGSPEQAEKLTGLPITALFPTVKNPRVFSKAGLAARSMFEQLLNAINIEVTQDTTRPYPPIIALFSIRPKQGKTWVINGLNRLYADADQQVAYCYPRQTGKENREYKNGVTLFPYTIRPDFMNVTGMEYLIDADQEFDARQYDRIILELPPLISNQIPVFLLKASALSILVIDASSAWARAEKQLLILYQRVVPTQPLLTVLNRVGGDYIETRSRADVRAEPKPAAQPLQPQRNTR
jgi:uncharacterized protein involved in exopolysaccharide biosynthesis